MKTEEITEFCPTNKQEWRNWLEKNHLSKKAVWLVMYKKASNVPTISWSEAVDEALCFGWIDSVKQSVDSKKYRQYFGLRKPTSSWSKINKDKVELLLKEGLIAPAGIKTIEIAKQNGTWTIMDEVEQLIIPTDLLAAFKNYPTAKSYFLGLSKSIRKGMLHWVVTAKRPETRAKRINEIAEQASKNLKPKHFTT